MAALAAAAALSVAIGVCGGDPKPAAGPVPLSPELVDSAPPPERWIKPLGMAIELDPLRSDDTYRRVWAQNATSVTPENALKFNVVQPRQGEFDFGAADAIIAAGERLNKRVRGHPLIWDEQLPGWLTDTQRSPQEVEAILREHVTTIVRRYRGRVKDWDVVNEPLEGDGSLTPNLFFAALGERYIDIAFEAARAADPDARLMLNELYADRPGPKQTALLQLAGRLRERGVPIDGIGLQFHVQVDEFPLEQDLRTTMDAVGAAGLQLELTEMDVPLRFAGELTPETARAQADAYGIAARACATHPVCTGLTLWGVTDRFSWLGEDRHPLPFDTDGNPKPAWPALRDAFTRRP